MTVSYKDWHAVLHFALHGYRTSVRTSTGATLFLLVYGMEVVLPFEVEVPSLRILAESRLKKSEWAQARFDQLNLIEDKRLAAMSQQEGIPAQIQRSGPGAEESLPSPKRQ